MTVHPLGGCRIGDTADDARGGPERPGVHGDRNDGVHRGLYVCDGSIIPMRSEPTPRSRSPRLPST